MRQFDTGATRDDAEGKPDYRGFLSPLVLRRFGEYMLRHQVQPDGQLRASDNWKKGIPQEAYLSSLLRHVVDLWRAFEDPRSDVGDVALNDLLCAVLFNTQGLLHERLVGGSHGQADAKLNPDIDPGALRFAPAKTITVSPKPEWEVFREWLESADEPWRRSHLACAAKEAFLDCALYMDFKRQSLLRTSGANS